MLAASWEEVTAGEVQRVEYALGSPRVRQNLEAAASLPCWRPSWPPGASPSLTRPGGCSPLERNRCWTPCCCGTWTGRPARVRRALETGEHLAVYGDYDVDGITSTCLLTDCLRRMGGQVTPYIPDRLEEGYGLNLEAIHTLADQG